MSDDVFPDMTRLSLYKEIEVERFRQNLKWGGPDHDDTHGWLDWGDLVGARTDEPTREHLIEAAALLLAWIESDDRKFYRHVMDPNE